MVVEDEPPVRALLRMVLESGGFETIEAVDGVEAAAALRRRGGRVDLVVSDMNMPRMNGLALAAIVRAEFPGTRFLLVTGYAATPVEGIEVIRKPFLPTALLAAAHEALGGSRMAAAPAGDETHLPGVAMA